MSVKVSRRGIAVYQQYSLAVRVTLIVVMNTIAVRELQKMVAESNIGAGLEFSIATAG